MNDHINAIAGRLSLRAPQRRSLEILDRITEIVPPRKGADLAAALKNARRNICRELRAHNCLLGSKSQLARQVRLNDGNGHLSELLRIQLDLVQLDHRTRLL